MNWTTIKEALKSVKKEVVYGVLIALAVIFMVRSCTARRNNDRQARLSSKIVTELQDSITCLNNEIKQKNETIEFYKKELEYSKNTLKVQNAVIASQNKTIGTQEKLIKANEE